MKNQLNIRIHNPNSPREIENLLLKICMEANEEKVKRAIDEKMMENEREVDIGLEVF